MACWVDETDNVFRCEVSNPKHANDAAAIISVFPEHTRRFELTSQTMVSISIGEVAT